MSHAGNWFANEKWVQAWMAFQGALSAGAADGLPEGGAIEIFAQVHQSKEGIEDARFHLVGQMQTTGGRACQQLAMFGDEFDDFHLACVRRLAVYGFAAHFPASLFDLQREVQHAQMLGFECLRHLSLAPIFATGCRHGPGLTPNGQL
jgi:hypothetical protein